MLLKIWPHLTFGWPFVNISLTIHPTHSKLYIFCDPYNLTSNLIYMKGHLKHFEMLIPTRPLRDPYWEGAKSSKILSKYFLTYKDFKTINYSFSSKWHFSTSSTPSNYHPNNVPRRMQWSRFSLHHFKDELYRLLIGRGDNLQLFISPLLKYEEWLYNTIDDKNFEINSLEPPTGGLKIPHTPIGTCWNAKNENFEFCFDYGKNVFQWTKRNHQGHFDWNYLGSRCPIRSNTQNMAILAENKRLRLKVMLRGPKLWVNLILNVIRVRLGFIGTHFDLNPYIIRILFLLFLL